jgi:hypothetical protein
MARLSVVGALVCLFVAIPLLAGVAVAVPVDGSGDPGAVGAGPSESVARGAEAPDAPDAQEFDRTVFTIEVYPNGSARWTFSYRRGLANETERQRFQSFADSFNENETETYRDFKQRAEGLTRAGTNETGREMNATAFEREAGVNRLGNQGIVEMSFLWTNFAVRTDGRIVVGDTFEGGLYVGPDQQLIVQWDDDLRVATVDPAPDQNDSNSLVWVGGEDGRQFLDGRPRVEFVPNGTNGSGANSTIGSGNGTGGPLDGVGGFSLWPLGLLLGAALVVATAVAYREGMFTGGDRSIGDGGGDAAADASGGDRSAPAGPTVADEELMTDEDRVLSLLAENGGRMKQVNIVEETGWSKSKVSMLLSEMEENDQISKLRVGRENIISTANDEPNAAGSPFDDE